MSERQLGHSLPPLLWAAAVVERTTKQSRRENDGIEREVIAAAVCHRPGSRQSKTGMRQREANGYRKGAHMGTAETEIDLQTTD